MHKRIVLGLLLIGLAAWSASAAVAEKFSYKGAPENYNNGTMQVNDAVIAMSEKVFIKNQFLVDSIPDTPSVFFIIDNSGSMGYWNIVNNQTIPLNDSNGYRFKVTNAFIDSVYKKYPTAEMGFAVFDTNLVFVRAQDTILRTTSNGPRDSCAYMPLLNMSKIYEGMTGQTMLHKWLKDSLVSIPSSLRHYGMTTCVDLAKTAHRFGNGPNGTGSTNINAGFAAAKSAMAASVRPKQNRYIVFLSDGNANYPANNPFSFVRGDSTPTTFTIFFTKNDTLPPSIDTMTTNIRMNGYSISNLKSDCWPYVNTTFSSLMGFLMRNVYASLPSLSLGAPSALTIQGQTVSSWNTDSSFTFGNLFPLTGVVTPFNFKIDYKLTQHDGTVIDSIHNVNFNVQRNSNLPNDTTQYAIWKWDRSLLFRTNGAAVSTIDDNADSVELRFAFDPGSAGYTYTNATVKLSTISGTPDSETYALTRIGSTDTFAVKFRSMIGAAARGDHIIEHAAVSDTIVAIFRNSEPQGKLLLLDTLRATCPYHARPDNILLTVSNDTIQAGDTATISGLVTSRRGDTIGYLADSIHWKEAAPLKPGDTLADTLGRTTRVTATQAWDAQGNHRVLLVIATVTNPCIPNNIVRDTAKIVILPRASGQKLSIERYADTALSRAEVLGSRPDFYTAAQPLEQIIMDSAKTQFDAYAVVRDQFGNFISLTGTTTAWNTLTPDTVAVVLASLKDIAGIGVISRANNMHQGSGRVVVTQPGCTPDTVQVILHFDGLNAIALFNASTGQQVNSVVLNTDQSISLVVKGTWASNPGVWSNINTLWAVAPNPDTLRFTTPVPTTLAGTWTCYPLNPGNGTLTVRSGNLSVSIPMTITAGAVTTINLQLLTNPDSCIAGKPIKLAASVRNSLGFIPGTSVYTARYHDILTDPTSKYQPWLSVNGSVDSLDKPFSETFHGGLDTLSIVLYYAPRTPPDSHKVQLTLSGIVPQGTTVPFFLKAGPIDSLQIEDSAGNHLVDTIIMTQLRITAHLFGRGFDHYGNRIEPDNGSGLVLKDIAWKIQGGLPAFDSTGADVLYKAPYSRVLETGSMRASLQTLTASVPIKVMPAVPMLISAVTRDVNENGLIDHIDCVFDTTLGLDPEAKRFFTVKEPSPYTAAWTVTEMNANSDRSYTLTLAEMDSTNAQTAWKPTVRFAGDSVGSIDITQKATDGCAPVLWRAFKHVNGADHHSDWVEVDLSEPIVDKSNPASPFSLGTRPDATFFAWSKEGAGFTRRDALLNGITTFDNNQPSNRLVFTMRNGADLTDTNYLNVQTPANGSRGGNIVDAAGNAPSLTNHKVRVQIGGNSVSFQTYGNPGPGTTLHENHGQIQIKDQGSQAAQWAQFDGGFAIKVQLVDSVTNISLQIYDIIGNLVNYASSSVDRSLIPDYRLFWLYWNGTNRNNTVIAPGVYRLVMTLKYGPGSKKKDEKIVMKLGVRGHGQPVVGR